MRGTPFEYRLEPTFSIDTKLEKDMAVSFATCPVIRIVFEQNHRLSTGHEHAANAGSLLTVLSLMASDPTTHLPTTVSDYIKDASFVRFMRAILCHKNRYEICGMECAPVSLTNLPDTPVSGSVSWAGIRQSISKDLPIDKDKVNFIEWDTYLKTRPVWEAPPEPKVQSTSANFAVGQ